MIEIGAAELAIDEASDEEIASLEASNDRLKRAADKKIDDPQYLRDLDLNVHYALFQITKNRFVNKIGRVIYRLFLASIEKTVEIDSYRAYRNHKLYIDAIKKRDKGSVGAKVRLGLTEWMDYVNR